MESDPASGEYGSGPALPLTHSACPPRAAHPPLRLEVLHERRRLAHAGILSAGRGASHRIVLYSTWWRNFLLHCLLYSVVLYFIAFFRQGQAVVPARSHTLFPRVPTRSHTIRTRPHASEHPHTPTHTVHTPTHTHTRAHTPPHASTARPHLRTPSHSSTHTPTRARTRPPRQVVAGRTLRVGGPWSNWPRQAINVAADAVRAAGIESGAKP